MAPRKHNNDNETVVRRDRRLVASCSLLVAIGIVVIAMGVADAQAPTVPQEAVHQHVGPAELPVPVAAETEVEEDELDVDGWLLYQLPGAVAADVFASLGAAQPKPCPATVVPAVRDALLVGDPAAALGYLDLARGCRALAVSEAFARVVALERLGRFADVLTAIEEVPSDIPIGDYVLIAKARALRALQRPQEAAPVFAAVADGSRGPLYHAARVERALSLAEASQHREADKALTEMITDYPEYPMVERLLLARGEARMALGQRRAAAIDFDRIVFKWPWKHAATAAAAALVALSAEGVHAPTKTFDERYERAQWLRINKHWDIAEAAFRDLRDEVKTDTGTSEVENRLSMQIALNFFGASRYDDALPILEKLAEQHARRKGAGTSRDAVYTTMINCHAYSGRFDEALAVLQARDATRSEANQHRELASFFEMTGRYDRALRHWDMVLNSSGKRTWHYAFLLYKVERYGPAIRLLRDLARGSGGTTRTMYTYWIARAQMERGELDHAVDTFTEVIGRDEDGYYGIQAANRLAEIEHFRDTNPNLAPDLVANAEPEAADDGVLLGTSGESVASGSESGNGAGGDQDVVVEQLQPALEGFGSAPVKGTTHGLTEREVAGSPGASGPTAVKGAAKSYAPHIKSAPAKITWGQIPLAADRFESVRERVEADAEGDVVAIDPAYVVGPSIDGALAAAARQYGELFPHLIRASLLFDIGLETEARWELRDVALEFRGLDKKGRAGRGPAPGKPWALGFSLYRHFIDNRSHKSGYWGIDSRKRRYPVPSAKAAKQALAERQRAIIAAADSIRPAMIAALKEGGDYYIVRKFAHDQSFTKTDPLNGDRRNLWSEAFPRAFPRLVQQRAAAEGLDPYLMWALMTVESSYNPDSVSTADARGLLQVIPRTGIKVATTLGVDEYGPHDLLDERVSIRFGTWYFAQLVDKFHGQELFAMAGYNGGPHNVARWVTMRGHALAMDEFVETIPFDQARNYTKKVTKFAALYQRIYERNATTYVGNVIQPTFKEHPNY